MAVKKVVNTAVNGKIALAVGNLKGPDMQILAYIYIHMYMYIL